MTRRLQFQRRAYLGAVAVALLGALLVMVSPPTPVSAATSSQYAQSWSVDHPANWVPAPNSPHPLGTTTGNCTGGSAAQGVTAYAEFTFDGFAIPAGDEIDGIVVTPKYRSSSNNATIALRDGGVQLGSKPLPTNGSSTCNGTSTLAIGGATDTWGATLTPAQVNDGIQVRITFSNSTLDLDNIQLTVHHSPPAPEADLSVNLSDNPDPATPGGSLTYTLVVDNDGPDADPSASVTTNLPPDVACTYTSSPSAGATGNTAGTGNLAETLSLPVGASVEYTFDCTVASDATNFMIHSASVTGSVADPLPDNNAEDETTNLVPEADLAVTKTDGVVQATPGESVTYEIVASNAGPSDEPYATLSDTLPSDLSCTYTSVAAGGATGNTAAGSGDLSESLSLPAGSSVTYTADCAIDATATGTLSNTATISGSVDDPAPGNNEATDDDTVLSPESDLAVTIGESADPVTAGDPADLVYTVTATNTGPSAATGTEVEVTLTIPSGVTLGFPGASTGSFAATTWDVGTLAPGDVETLTLPLTVAESTAAGTDVIEVDATISSDAADDNPTNDSASEATSVEAAPAEPTTTTTAPETTTTTEAGNVQDAGVSQDGSGGGALPRTGAGFLPLVLIGLLSMLGGGITVWSAERRNAYVGTHLR